MAPAHVIDLQSTPDEPGVYLFKDEAGTVLYVGKAASLRARLASYRNEPDPRKAAMVEKAADVEVMITATEKDALVLENTLIKRHRPRYNVRLTDDRRYPYLELTRDPWPRVRITRETRGKGMHFGPFPDAGSARRTLQVIREVFKVRDCKELIPGGCLNYQMDLCSAPCILDPAERARKAPRLALATLGDAPAAHAREMEARLRARYAESVASSAQLLRGDADAVVRALTREMDESAERLDFERAASLRDRLQAITATLERQVVFSRGQEDRDAFVALREGPLAIGVVTLVRDGNVVGQEHFFIRRAAADSPAEILAELIPRYYEHLPSIPREVLVPEPLAGGAALEAWLAEKRGGPVTLLAPQKGDKLRLIEMARRNAEHKLALERLKRGERDASVELAELARALALPQPPRIIECFDISHLQGSGVVASMVALEDGKPARARYRRFKVKQDKNDDFAAMEEVVSRRYQGVMREGGELPGLVLIDGGRGQLAAAKRALDELGLASLPVAALAKREEEVFLPGRAHPVDLPQSSPALLTLMRARDEAHRFALDYQRRLRARSFTESALDELDGVGDQKKRALLAAFGSPERVSTATLEELLRVPGIGRGLAKRILAHFSARQ